MGITKWAVRLTMEVSRQPCPSRNCTGTGDVHLAQMIRSLGLSNEESKLVDDNELFRMTTTQASCEDPYRLDV